MKLVPTRPVTIESTRSGQRWFPVMFHLHDDSLLMYVQCGYDADFAPLYRRRSTDGGKSWHEEISNVPRLAWAHCFADGTLFEMDGYGFFEPDSEDTFCYYGAWSTPGAPNSPVQKEIVRAHLPSVAPRSLSQFEATYPTFPWWPLLNAANKCEEVTGEVFLGAPYVTDIEQVQERLLAVGFARHRDDEFADPPTTGYHFSVFCMASDDRGRNWRELSVVARTSGAAETGEGFSEATLTLLQNGKLYSVLRSGERLYHAWSEDEGRTWSTPEPLRLIDSDITPRRVWPRVAKLEDGTLVFAYGRPGKHLVFDPSGTGTQWQGHLDLHDWELSTQELMGVAQDQRLRGDTGEACIRYWDSGDYLGVTPIGAREMLVIYDVQNYVESWNAAPVVAVRMVRVELQESS